MPVGPLRERPLSPATDDVTYPLSGLRVLDFTTFATGPFATEILAALGATVLKVERPPAGDPERNGEHAMFVACNRGKFSVALDAKHPDDRELVDRLVADA